MGELSLRTLMIAAALAFATAAPVHAQTADAPKAESHAKTCHGADGKAAPCAAKARKGTPKTKVATPMISQCRDVISHQLARCGGPNAEPVPAN